MNGKINGGDGIRPFRAIFSVPVLIDDHQVSTSTSVDETGLSVTSRSSICRTPLKTIALDFFASMLLVERLRLRLPNRWP